MWKLNYLVKHKKTLTDSFSAVSKPNFASKHSLESSRREYSDVQDSHYFAPLRPQYFSKSSSILSAFSKLDMLKVRFFQNFVVIFSDFQRICSDSLEKRCNYSKFLDSSLILWSHLLIIFDSIFDSIYFEFHIHTTPPSSFLRSSPFWGSSVTTRVRVSALDERPKPAAVLPVELQSV